LRQRFLYEYDFGDRWEHDVRLEKVLAWKGQICPVCTGGHRPARECAKLWAGLIFGDEMDNQAGI
jgi:hypothetical protein